MSCDTLNQGSIGLQVSMAQLPEGFCPTSMQELANAIAERLIVSPNQSFTSFAAGSIEPSSNVGPWLKDCLVWFVFDDNTARYVPIEKGGFNTEEFFTTSGTFVVPAGISKIKVTTWGAGGGGGNSGAAGGAGGGGGASAISILTVTPGQSIAYTVGAGGTTGGVAGGSTTFLTLTAGGGVGGQSGGVGSPLGGLGGVATGGTRNFNGGAGGSNDTSIPGVGGDSPGGGQGGAYDFQSSRAAIINGTFPGGGGAGGGNGGSSTGSGAGGAILVEY